MVAGSWMPEPYDYSAPEVTPSWQPEPYEYVAPGELETAREFIRPLEKPTFVKPDELIPTGYEKTWADIIKSYFQQDPAGLEAYKRSPQGFISYTDPNRYRYGPETARKLGFLAGTSISPEKAEPWFKALSHYDVARANQPAGGMLNILPYWARGAQLGLLPDEYIELASDVNEQGAAWREQVESILKPWRESLTLPERTGLGTSVAPPMPTLPPKPQLSATEQYLLGFSNEPPPGYVPMPTGRGFERGLGTGRPPEREPQERRTTTYQPRQSAEEWFKEQYPDIAEKLKMPSGRFAPKVKTIGY